MNSTMGTALENHDNVFVLFYLIVQVHCETMNNSFLERDIYVLCFQSDSHSFLLASKSPKRSDWHQLVRAEINNWRARPVDDAWCLHLFLLSCPKRALKTQFPCHLSTTNGSRSEPSESKQLTPGADWQNLRWWSFQEGMHKFAYRIKCPASFTI